LWDRKSVVIAFSELEYFFNKILKIEQDLSKNHSLQELATIGGREVLNQVVQKQAEQTGQIWFTRNRLCFTKLS